jgi:hypothetical protein
VEILVVLPISAAEAAEVEEAVEVGELVCPTLPSTALVLIIPIGLKLVLLVRHHL